MNSTLFAGILRGLEMMGAKVVKITDTHLFIDITSGSDMDDHKRKVIAKGIVKDVMGLTLRVKTVKKPNAN